MVVVGHSMGGILAHMVAADSGREVWDAALNVPPEELRASPATRAAIDRLLFFHPLSYVRRVIFIATPHRGSRLANGVVGRVFGRRIQPPFDKGALQPGYIKGYVPGIRENGGLYTHAATWVVLATALQGHGDRALELWNLINPVRHTGTPEAMKHYKVEPYVVCADVYGAPPLTSRGGWTWYTGSAGWRYRVALEAILGFRPEGSTLRLDPCIPQDWPGFEINYRHRSTMYRVRVDNSAGTGRGVRSVVLDGRLWPGGAVPLDDDRMDHEVLVELG
jgi:hypothetical protein